MARRSGLQVLRGAVQWGTAGIVLLTAALHAYSLMLHQESFRRGEASWLWAWLHGLRGVDDNVPQLLAPPLSGHWWAFEAFGVRLIDPLALVESALAARGVGLPLLLAGGLPLVVTALLGRVYCSWLCPMNLLLELNDRIRSALVRHLWTPFGLRVGGWWRYALLGAGLVAAWVGGVGVLGHIYPPALLSRALESPWAGVAAVWGLGFVGGIALLELLTVRRLWCRALCPGGALYSALSRYRLLRVVRDPGRCTRCGGCVGACPMGQAPMLDRINQDCTSCGLCIAQCGDNALGWEISLLGAQAKMVRRTKVMSLLLSGLVGASALVAGAGSADAHHILGRPHYSYSESYPELSTYEITARGEGHVILFTSFPGMIAPGDTGRLVVYIRDEAGRPYTGPVQMGLTRRHPWAASRVLVPLREPIADDARLKLVQRFEEAGEYTVDVVFWPNGKEEVLAFPLSVGEAGGGGVGSWAPVVLAALVVGFLIGIAVVRRRRVVRPGQVAPSVAALALLAALASGCVAEREAPPLRAASEPASSPACHPASEPDSQPASQPGAHGAHLMPGVPPRLAGGAVAAILLFTFVGFEVLGRRRQPGRVRRRWRFNLLRWAPLAALVRSRRALVALRLPVLAAFVLVIVAGLLGTASAAHNLAPTLTWTIWWILLVLIILLFGKAWCALCPWDALTDLTRRLLPWRRVDELTLNLRWPRWLRNIYAAVGLFLALTWLELGWDVTRSPAWTAWLGVAMVAMAVGSGVVFERKAFCQHACLVGRISGLYSLFSPIELRAMDPELCRRCETHACLQGSEDAYPCPTRQPLWAMTRNTYCTLCAECVRSCPHDNVALNLRPLGADLVNADTSHRSARPDEAIMALVMLALSCFHGLTMTPSWWVFTDAVERALGVGYAASFSVGMLLSIGAIVAVYASFVGLTRLAAGTGQLRELLIQLAYPMIPIALFYHLAHNAMHFLLEGQNIIPILSDPLGWGWDLFGTRELTFEPLLSMDGIWIVQIVLIAVGHIYSLYITHRIAPRVLRKGRVLVGQLPLLAMAVVYSLLSLWLVAQPMEMRTSM